MGETFQIVMCLLVVMVSGITVGYRLGEPNVPELVAVCSKIIDELVEEAPHLDFHQKP